MTKGTVVRLKSGGPNMTVVDTDSDNKVTCAWFDVTRLEGRTVHASSVNMMGTFPVEALLEIPPVYPTASFG